MSRHLSLLVGLVVAGVCAPASAADPADAHPDLHLIPWPKALDRRAGHMALTADSRVVAADDALKPLAAVLADEIARVTGLKLATAAGPGRPGDIVLKLNPGLRAGEPILMLRNREPVRTTDGAHTVTVGETAVVEGFDYRATAEGTATILQLLTKTPDGIRLPAVTIQDWPHADYCGVMLDVARQDHPIDAIKKVVQLCRFYKARYLQLHLTDDQGWTFPSTKYPELGSKNHAAHGGITPRVYTLDDLKALVAYADTRGVTLVPELEMPGHSGAALRARPDIFDAINPQSKQPVGMGCMNMSNEAIYPALDTLIGEMCDVCRSSPYFHIGSDEVTSGRLSLHPGYAAFMAKHGLKDDHQLADHFIAAVCGLVKKHGKKAIKWEGLANTATTDVIVMAWDANSTAASDLLARGYTTITCPWNLGVPWEQWNMYVCNGSRLKKGDSVLGATLVAWEQPPLTHVTNLRKLAHRQERTWGPDTPVTAEGFAARFQPLDAVAGRLIDMPPKPLWEATATTSVGTRDFLDPAFAHDGDPETFYQSAVPPKRSDHFTLTFPQAKQVHAIEVLTGVNHRGDLAGGEVQVSADGSAFATVATLAAGRAKATLTDSRVRAIRLRAATDQADPLVVRSIDLSLQVGVAGVVQNPTAVVGPGHVAVTTGDTEFAYPIGTCTVPVINRGFTLKWSNGGNPFTVTGPVSGSGRVELHAGGPNFPLVLDGKLANSMAGTWAVQAGRVVLAKEPGVDALSGTIRVGTSATIAWNAADQIADAAQVELAGPGSALELNGFRETIGRLTLGAGATVSTDGRGVLTVGALTVDGKTLPRGVYTAAAGWVRGSGFVEVGGVKHVRVSDRLANIVIDPNEAVGPGNMARVTTGVAEFKLPDGECSVPVDLYGGVLLLTPVGGKARFSGFLTGTGAVHIKAAPGRPLQITGADSNSFKGPTTLVSGLLRLNKPGKAIAVPGDLTVGGSAAENKDAAVVWLADGQVAPIATATLTGTQPAALDLNGHQAELARVVLSDAGVIRTGAGGTLRVKQLFVNRRRIADGTYKAPQPWLNGTGTVTVDSRVDTQGVVGSPEAAIGPGNVGNLTEDTRIAYPSAGGDFDIVTNGFSLALDSGNGNAFAYSGSISGTGNVEFHMGPTYTDYRDAPLRLVGPKANTATGKFLVKKGRVQLEKPEGTDAISGDVIVGGQGFNDGLFWAASHQLKDTVHITLLDAGNSGAAYLHLNGHIEAAASLTMTTNNRVRTDAANGAGGTLTVKALTVGGVPQAAGTYTAATAKWIVGTGRVIVRP